MAAQSGCHPFLAFFGHLIQTLSGETHTTFVVCTLRSDEMSEEEHFMTFTEDGVPCGLVPRSRVHAEGLLHRSVHILIVNQQRELLLARRSQHKDICPGYWDLSAAEHQRPGEAGFQSALRGISEELGIQSATLKVELPWRRYRSEYPQLRCIDYEETMTFSMRYSGRLSYADGEVCDTTWVPLRDLREFMSTSPHPTTPWMRRDLKALDLI